MQDSFVDLSLAVNYLPACVCILESAALSLALCVVHSIRLTAAYVGIGLCLAVGRLVYGRTRIMDKSSILLGIFLAHVVSEIQESSEPNQWNPLFQGAVSLEWPALAGYKLLLGAPKEAFSAGRRAQHWEFAVACGHVAACAFQSAPMPEPRGVRVCRYMSFCLVCLCWMYVIGIFRRRVTQASSDSAVYFAVYFWPILYVHPYVAAAYSLCVLVSVAMHLSPAPGSQEPPAAQPHQPARLELISCDAAAAPEVEPTESLEELEVAFRQAMLSSNSKKGATQ